MRRLPLPFAILTLATLFVPATGCVADPEPEVQAPDTVIVNARVIDGTAAPAKMVAVRIRGDRIAEVGAVRLAPSDRLVDAGGKVLVPGFIDTHSHASRGLLREREALAAVSQGITTVVVGQDGSSTYPLEEFFLDLEQTPAAVNVASYAGHGTLRRMVLDEDYARTATAAEVAAMGELLGAEMESGAIGLSTGLEYDPGIYSSKEEVVALARVAAAHGGRYISHMRSEDRSLWAAVDEIIAIGREAGLPVQISHIKLAMRSLWGQADILVQKLRDARGSGVEITADVYPYTYWQSGLSVLFPERDFDNPSSVEFVLRELAAAEDIVIAGFRPDESYVGKTLAQISELRGTDDITTTMALLSEANGSVGVIARSMSEPDIEDLIAWPFSNICTDGGLRGRHPRGFGSFTRVLGLYVRERNLLTVEEAVRKMTSLPAANMGIADRGLIQPGYYADLVLFDPDLVSDRATIEAPNETSDGIHMVWVNGVLVYETDGTTGSYPGQVLRHNR
jgi:N-acyl-D-amino-acid deacylase